MVSPRRIAHNSVEFFFFFLRKPYDSIPLYGVNFDAISFLKKKKKKVDVNLYIVIGNRAWCKKEDLSSRYNICT